MRLCLKCGQEKPLDQFYNDKRLKSGPGKTRRCKSCVKEYEKTRRSSKNQQQKERRRANPRQFAVIERRRNYGTDGRGLLIQQGFRCGICGLTLRTAEQPSGEVKGCLDHCHATGVVRGWLCDNCNKALGWFKDNPVFLRSAIKYLERSEIFK